MVEVVYTDEFEAWWGSLTARQQKDVAVVVEMLQDRGVALGSPHSSAIKGSKKLRELRIQSGGRPLRVFYAFDPERAAVLLLGGDKTGRDRFYLEMIPKAEAILARYGEELSERKRPRG